MTIDKKYRLILVGTLIVLVGFILMASWQPEDLFSNRVMYVSPIIVLIGYASIGVGILKTKQP